MFIEQPVLSTFTVAAAELLQSALIALQIEDAEAAHGAALMLRQGGFASLVATIAPSTGMVSVRVELIDLAGNGHRIVTADLDPEVCA